MRLFWRKPEIVNYADNSDQEKRPGVSGLPTFDETGEVYESVEAIQAAGSVSGANGGNILSGVKSFFGTKSSTSYQAAHNAVAGAMALVSPWLANVVWTVNRAYFALAREAYGGNAVVYACLRLLSAAVAEPPMVPHMLDGDGNRQDLDFNHPLYKLIRHPNELMTEMTFVELCVIHMGLVGRCHWWKERDNLGRIKALWPLRPDRVGPLYAVQPVTAYGYAPYSEQMNTPTNVVSGAALALSSDNRVLAGWTYWPPGWSTPIRIPREDVMTINLSDPSGETGGVVEGLGPIQVLAREVEADNEATSYVAALLKNHAQPGAILHVKANLMRDKVAQFKREFKKAFGGNNRGDIAIFDGETAYQEVGFNMQELEFPNLRKVSESRIAASLGVPIMLAGFYSGLESANRSTLSEFREYFAETTLPGWWRRIQEQVTYDIATEYDEAILVAFDTSKVKALLIQAVRTIQPYQMAFKEGVVTVNEYRQNVLGLPPLEGPAGNMLYLPTTVMPTDAGFENFDTVGTGVAANYGGIAPDMQNTLQSNNDGRIRTPGEMATASPRLPGSDRPSPDSTSTSATPAGKVKQAMMRGTGVCYTCGKVLDREAKGFHCSVCLKKYGVDEPIMIDTYTHLGGRGKPWVPHMSWLSQKRAHKATVASSETSTALPLPTIPSDAKALIDKVMATEPDYTGRLEHRYLLPSNTLVMAELEKRSADVRPLRQYDVRTTYFDVPQGSWSTGSEEFPKMRWRQYLEDSGNAFFELKWNQDGVSTKKRIEQTTAPEGLTEVCAITYTRTEWETGALRITVDENVQTDHDATLDTTRRLPFYVVEVKGTPPLWLNFLLQYESDDFSKTKWALGEWQVPPPVGKTVYRGYVMSPQELGLRVGQIRVEDSPFVVTHDKHVVDAMLKGKGTLIAIKGIRDFNGYSLPPSRLRILSMSEQLIEAEMLTAEDDACSLS